MIPEYLPALCKVVGVLITGALGILAVISEFRDATTKQITLAGRANILGILLAMMIAATGEWLTARQAESDSLSQAQANGKILTNVENLLTPLAGLMVSRVVDIDYGKSEIVKAFVSRLNTEAQAWTLQTQPQGVSEIDFGNGVKGFAIEEGSPAFPSNDREPALSGALAGLDLNIYFNRKPQGVDVLKASVGPSFDYQIQTSPYPGIATPPRFGPLAGGMALIYVPSKNTLYVQTSPARVDGEAAKVANPGGIFGATDLRGGRFAACIRAATLVGHEQESVAVFQTFRLRQITIRLTVGKAIILQPQSDSARYTQGDSSCFYFDMA